MTEYKYRWVGVRSMGVDTPENVDRVVKLGWEPAPADDPMRPPDQLVPGMKATPAFILYRLPIEVANERERLQIAENKRLGNPETHVREANANIEAFKRGLNAEHGRTDAGKGWSPIFGSGATIDGNETIFVPKIRHWQA